jgi:hypothetical protein
MSQAFEPVASQPLVNSASNSRAAIYVAFCAFLPIVTISLFGWWYRDSLSSIISIDLTNFDAIRKLLHSFIHPSDQGDSWLPMQHALEILNGPDRGRLYETLFLGAHVRFQYPPTSLLPFEVLSTIGMSSIRALNALNSLVYLLNACAVAVLGWLLFRDTSRRAGIAPSGRAMAALAFAASFAFYPLLRAQILGQIQLWIDLLFTLALLSWFLQRRLLAGLLIGLACTIKPQMGLLLLWGLLWRDWRFVTGILAAAVPVLLLSLLRYGVHNHIAYLDVLSFLSRHGESFFANNSVNGILNWYLSSNDSLRWYDGALTPFNPGVFAGTMMASVAALALICAMPLLRRRSRPDLSDLGIAAICTVAGSPVAWEHHYGILLPLFLVALRAAFRITEGRRRDLAAIALTVSWVMVADFIPFAGFLAHTAFAVAQAYCFFGALVLLAFLLRAKHFVRQEAAGAPG